MAVPVRKLLCLGLAMNKDAGFTFVEVIVVLVMIGLLASFAIPAMYNAVQRNRVFTSTELVAAQIREARLAAITHNRTFRVRFDCFGGRAVRMMVVTGNPAIDQAADRCSLTQPDDGSPFYVPPDVTVTSGSELAIDGRGFITAISGTMPQSVSVTYGSFTRTLQISGTGRVVTPAS